jgi:hypothetical protein
MKYLVSTIDDRPQLPFFETLIQFANVDFGKDKRFETSCTGKPPSVAIFTASSRNSFVYRALGILSISTPPSWFLPKHRCPFFSTYINIEEVPDGRLQTCQCRPQLFGDGLLHGQGGQIDVGNQGFSRKRVRQQRSGFHLRGRHQGHFAQSHFNLDTGSFFREENR